MTIIRAGVRRAVLAAAVAAAALWSADAGQAQSSQLNALYQRIQILESEVSALRRQGGGGGAAAGGEVGYRLSSIEDQLRRVVGEIERISHQMRELDQQLKRYQDDAEFRFQQLEGGGRRGEAQPQQRRKAVTEAFPEGGQESPPEAPIDREAQSTFNELDLQSLQSGEPAPQDGGGSGLPQQAPEAQAAPQPEAEMIVELDEENTGTLKRAPGPQVLGTISADAVESGGSGQATFGSGTAAGGGQDPGAPAGGTGDDVQSAALGSEPTAASDPAEVLYERSYDSLVGRQFDEAEAGFRNFLSRYGEHKLASNAQFWLGETYFAQGDYRTAAKTFLTGYQTYPKAAKAPDTLLRLGMSLRRLGQKEQACGAYAEVNRKYPKAKARETALKEMKRDGC